MSLRWIFTIILAVPCIFAWYVMITAPGGAIVPALIAITLTVIIHQIWYKDSHQSR
jgi:hypothetical protein